MSDTPSTPSSAAPRAPEAAVASGVTAPGRWGELFPEGGSSFRLAAPVVAIAVAYFLAHEVSFFFPDRERVLAAIWPAGGIGLAALLLSPRRLWPTILAALFVAGNLANLVSGRPLVASLGFMSANALESLGCALVLQRVSGPAVRFVRVRDLVGLTLGTVVVNGATACIGAGTGALSSGAAFCDLWISWWIADGLGLLIVTPFMVTWVASEAYGAASPVVARWPRTSWLQMGEGAAFLALWGVVARASFHQAGGFFALRPYMLTALIAWPALRFGPRLVSLAFVLLAGFSVTSDAVTVGPLVWGGDAYVDRLLAVQLFLGFSALVGFLLAASRAEARGLARARSMSQQTLRTLVDNTPDIIVRFDRNLRHVFVNRAGERMSGQRLENLLGRSHRDLGSLPSETVELAERALRGIFDTGAPVDFETTVPGPNGPVSLLSRGVPELDEQGQVQSALVILRDITDRKRAEDRLKDSEERYRRLFGVESDAVLLIDAATLRVLDANPAACRLYGYSREELLALCATDVSAELGKTQAAIADNIVDVPLRWHRKRDGSVFPVEISASYFSVRGRSVHVAAIRDVTCRKQLETQLLESQKLEALGTLAGGIAHEINNVLGVVMGLGSLVEARLPAGDSGKEDLGEIVAAAKRGREVITNLMGFARRGKCRKELVCANDLTRTTVDLLSRTSLEKIAFRTNLESNLPAIEGDSSQLQQVLVNLCSNARDAIPAFGTISLSTAAVRLDAAEAGAIEKDLGPGSYVRLTVTDDGTGMDGKTLARAFEPFFTTKPVGKGTGLGLPMVYGTVKNHGGAVTIASAVREGTTVAVYLPVASAPTQAIGAPDPQGVVTRGRGRVLVVDDDPTVRRVWTRLLESLGYSVRFASGGNEALAVYREERGRIDLVMLDLAMPEMDGVQTFAALRQLDAGVRVLVCTGLADEADAAPLLARGALGVLHKPFDVQKMSSVLSQLVPGDDVRS